MTCWGIAALVGVLAMVMLYWMADFGAMQAIFTGGLIGVVLGAILLFSICRGQTAAADLASDNKPATRHAADAADRNAARVAATQGTTSDDAGATPDSAVAASSAAGSGGSTAASAAASNATPSAAFVMQPSKPLAGQAELASRKGDWKYEGNTKAVAAAKPVAVSAAPAAKAKPAPKAKAKPATAVGAKPDTMLSAARPEGKDDLKLISGVGPKLEQTLNDLGVYHFDQVAKWKKKDIAWVDDNLRFKGRIERDDWMSQAKILAKGGETEFSKKKKKT